MFRNEQSEEMERLFVQSQCGFWPGQLKGTQVPSSSAVLGGVFSTAATPSHTADGVSQGATTPCPKEPQLATATSFCCAPGGLGNGHCVEFLGCGGGRTLGVGQSHQLG